MTSPTTSAQNNLGLNPSLRTHAIASINVKLGVSALCAVGSYVFWPSSIEWWGFAVHSICLGGMSVALLIGGVRAMANLRGIEQAIAAYEALGPEPKGAHMADAEALVAAGMMDVPQTAKASKLNRLYKFFGRTS